MRKYTSIVIATSIMMTFVCCNQNQQTSQNSNDNDGIHLRILDQRQAGAWHSRQEQTIFSGRGDHPTLPRPHDHEGRILGTTQARQDHRQPRQAQLLLCTHRRQVRHARQARTLYPATPHDTPLIAIAPAS